MSLHAPTLLLAMLLATGLFALSLATARRHLQELDALTRWAVGTACLAAGFAMVAARVVLPEAVSIIAGNSLIAASLHCFSDATHRFVRQQAAPRWHAGLAVAVPLCAIVAVHWPTSLRISLLSALYAAQVAAVVALIVRRAWQAERSLRTVAYSMGASSAALAVRTVHALVAPEQYEVVFAQSLGNSLTYLTSFLFPLGAGFGFLLAHLERTANQLQVMATRDALTGCANRGLFDALLRHGIDRAQREHTALSLVLVDLDHFKQVNDAHGHPTGDLVLRRTATALRERLRASDVLARTGGEEFAVLLPGSDLAGSRRAAEELRRTIEAMVLSTPAGVPLRVTASLGIATLAPDGASSPEALYAAADDMLYRAKAAGRNRCLHEVDLSALAVAASG